MTTETINEAWGWKGIVAIEIVRTNDFGNVICKTAKNDFWRICPEELLCEKIADNETELEQLLSDLEFELDWKMERLLIAARTKLGDLESGQKYCLKAPGSGEYSEKNLGKISFAELISFSGYVAFQIKDLKDGDEFEFVTVP